MSQTKDPIPTQFSDPIAQCIWNYKDESETARRNRYLQNRQNFEAYHLRQDFSHKKRGQSKEFLAKQSVATEQLVAFLQQGLIDMGDWFRIDLEAGVDETKQRVHASSIQKLLVNALAKVQYGNDAPGFTGFFGDDLKLGLLGSLMIVKVGTKYVDKTKFEARPEEGPLGERRHQLIKKKKKICQLDLRHVRQEDYYPDPTGRGLYEIQRIEMDWHELEALAKQYPDQFDLDAINNCQFFADDLQAAKKSRETGQNITLSQYRRVVTLYQHWGTLVEQTTGRVIKENCVATIDNQGNVVQPPMENPHWHGKSPFVVSPIIRVPLSVWHKALMDAPTRHNLSMNELYNLMLDAGMMEVHGIKQLHSSWLENSNQVSEGIPPGTTLLVNSSCPPGAKVLERVDTSALTQESTNLFNIQNQEFNQSAFTNDFRTGVVSQRQVKATELVAANQSINGIMKGLVTQIEEGHVDPLLEKCWLTLAQHMGDLDKDEVKDLVGEDQANIICNMSPEEIFADTATGHKFKTFGLSQTLNKIQDFRKIQSLLQTIGTSPMMMQEFTRVYSVPKLISEVVKSLDIDPEKIQATPQEQAQRQQEMQMQAQAQAQGQNTQGGQGTNPQSQIPQAAASSAEANPVAIPRGAGNIGMTHPGQ